MSPQSSPVDDLDNYVSHLDVIINNDFSITSTYSPFDDSQLEGSFSAIPKSKGAKTSLTREHLMVAIAVVTLISALFIHQRKSAQLKTAKSRLGT